ncbi:probable inactive purple acid phosphatase 2 [Coccomyxa sp. Obi]|nr:probable inactive purple acid phosphatase 2 [Coccomyxa sp. Obi]
MQGQALCPSTSCIDTPTGSLATSRCYELPKRGDNFSPNPGNKTAQGPNPICTASGTGPFVTCDSKGECGTITATRFTQPGIPNFTPSVAPTSGPSRQKWYSYNYGVIHFLSYSSEEPYAPGTPQYQFIANDLANVDRTKTPWVVVGAHRPMYADSTDFTGLPDPSKNNVVDPTTADEDDGDQYVAREQRQYLEPLFANANVDVFYNGHKHIFYRTCPIRFGACASTRDSATGAIQGTVYVTGGNAGRSLANPAKQLLEENKFYASFATAYYNGTLNAFPDPFEAVNGGYHVNSSTTVYGYQRLTANATHLTLQPMDVTSLPAKPFVDAAAAFTLGEIASAVSGLFGR